MLDKEGKRQLVYVVRVGKVEPIEGYDRVEFAHVNGWGCVVPKDAFHEGDLGVYFEIDSKCPAKEPFLFLQKRNYRIRTQKMCKRVSQGLLMAFADFGWEKDKYAEGDFLTDELGVTYYEPADNERKAAPMDKYRSMAQRHKKVFANPLVKRLMREEWGRKILFAIFGKKRDKKTGFPKHFAYIKPTDQERCENMPWVLEDKTPFIRTQKCDGSSGTYILERKPFGRYEFYVCSRNVRQLKEDQVCFHDKNYYWEVALKYDIENKLKDYLKKHKDLQYVCWQGEICAPSIQKNPHKLSETHFYCFHMIDSQKGKYDIREAQKIWQSYNMEIVPIDEELYVMPDDFDEFKASAEGLYDSSVCEGQNNCAREGYVYYKSTDPNFHFKNVSRSYLLKHNG